MHRVSNVNAVNTLFTVTHRNARNERQPTSTEIIIHLHRLTYSTLRNSIMEARCNDRDIRLDNRMLWAYINFRY